MALLHYFKRIDASAFQQQTESQFTPEKETAAAVKTKRGPGRPRKRKVHLSDPSASGVDPSSTSTSSSTSLTDSSLDAKRRRCDWFSSPFIHDIMEAVRVFRSCRAAVEHLQKKFPRLPTEEYGRFDSLNEATVRYWFDDEWRLKEQFATLAKPRRPGTKSIIDAALEEKIISHLLRVREKGQSLASNVIRTMVMAIITKEGREDILSKHKISQQWCRLFVATKLNWTFRRATTGSSLPLHWRDDGVKLLKRIAIRIDEVNHSNSVRITFDPSLLINFDQTGVHLVPKSNYTYASKGSGNVAVIGEDDRRQITAVMASSADGDLLPLQLIFQGKTERCEPTPTDDVKRSLFHITHSENHWSNQTTMEAYIERIIQPYIQQKIVEKRLPRDSRAIVLLDCWSVHKSAEFRTFVKKKYKNIILVFIPPNCTSKLQICDTHLNFPFKRGIRNRFNQWTMNTFVEQLEKDDTLDVDLKMSTLKPLVLQWCHETWEAMRQQREYIVGAWTSLFTLFDPFSPANQLQAYRDSSNIQLDEDYKEDEKNAGENDYESDDEDEDKDELDVMKEIRGGMRRSERNRKPPRQIGSYMVNTAQLQIEEDYGNMIVE
jgi:hypothetical protein